VPSSIDMPAADARTRIQRALDAALADLAPGVEVPATLERPKQSAHGDYASNAALALGKKLKRNPREVAVSLSSRLLSSLEGVVEKTEIAGPGFVNLFSPTLHASRWCVGYLPSASVTVPVTPAKGNG
jgi:arginyl-tRNA synthetase